MELKLLNEQGQAAGDRCEREPTKCSVVITTKP